MADKEWTFEEIDKHVRAANLDDFEPKGSKHFTAEAVKAAPGDVLTKICAIYHVVKPILVAISNFPLIPAAWKKAIKSFINLLNVLCPG